MQLEGGFRKHASSPAGRPGRPLVSVLTIVRNGEAYLEHAVQSILSQTYPNIEYIIMDGGSTDGTLGIIRKYEGQIAYWKSEKDRGISDAFNKGISSATGAIVGILNADDWYEPEAVQNVVGAFSANPEAGIVYGWTNYWHENKLEYIYKSNHSQLGHRMSLSHPAVFILKRVYEQYGGFNEGYRYAMDYELLLRLYHLNIGFVRVPKVLANYTTGGVSYLNWMASFNDVARAKVKYDGRFAAYGYFAMQVLRKYLAILLFKFRLGALVDWYRERYMSGY